MAAPIWLSLILPCAALAAQTTGKQTDIVFTTSAPKIDGLLNDIEWRRAARITDFHEVKPVEFDPASESVTAQILYDEDNIYVALRIEMHDTNDISAFQLGQGSSLDGDDRVSVYLDPYNNARSGYRFDLNPNGVRFEALYAQSGGGNGNWRGIWEGRSQRNDSGWTAEFAIPFKTLNFDRNNPTWGMSFMLRLVGRNEHIAWTSGNRIVRPGLLGEVTGITRARQGLGLDLVPSVSFRNSRDFESGDSEFRTEPSLDVFYKITPALTSALTINTDFSAAEVDDRVVNLDRFSVFFPEKRAFFLQDSDIFSFANLDENGIPFFSRRLGLDEDRQPVDIKAGIKLTGRVGPFNVGMVDVLQESNGDDVNLFVGRAFVNVLENSTLGLIVTDGSPDANESNSVMGTDFNYTNRTLLDKRSIFGNLWYQQSDSSGFRDDQDAFGMRFTIVSGEGITWRVEHTEIGENFSPALGFVNRGGIRETEALLRFSIFPDAGVVQEKYGFIEIEHVEDLDGNVESQELSFSPLEWNFRNGVGFGFGGERSREVLTEPFEISDGVVIAVGDYRWNSWYAYVESPNQHPLVFYTEVVNGDFFDGSRLELYAGLLWQPSMYFSTEANLSYNDIDLQGGEFITRLMTLKTTVSFNNEWSLSTLMQYDNDSNEMSVNSRLKWIPTAGQEAILVVNHGFLVDSPLPDNRESFSSLNSDVVLKASYTFRF